ncbi:hypothetical protein OL548_13350 [Lysinibacillus sp. MHQ-1]|nr:hypothetical protein OL548_13350 [Lysinibacillus sp. MHQ-1]
MSLEMERRVAKLEEEMAELRQELSELRRIQSNEKINTLDARQSMIEQSVPIKPKPTPKPTVESKTTPVKTAQKEVQPQPSMEERVMWALPKVFMVILVMGGTLGSQTC